MDLTLCTWPLSCWNKTGPFPKCCHKFGITLSSSYCLLLPLSVWLFYGHYLLKVAPLWSMNRLNNKQNFKLEMSTLSSGHPGHSHLGQPGWSRCFKQWRPTGAVGATTLKSMNGLDCKWIGRGPTLQTVANNSYCGAKADGITQPARSVGTIWISYMSIFYVMNTNMPNLCLTAKLWHPSLEKKERGS